MYLPTRAVLHLKVLTSTYGFLAPLPVVLTRDLLGSHVAEVALVGDLGVDLEGT